jgi:phage-related protein
MAYNNPFWYSRDNSIDSKYNYVKDLTIYKPIYGSSVSFSSRLNFLQTTDNALKILPSSENNLTIKYNLKFLLDDSDSGNLLKTLELGGGYRYLKFLDPSGLYQDFIGLVEDYSINKNTNNLTEINIIISSYFKAPIFKWRTSSILSNITEENTTFSASKKYNKYDFIYIESNVKNKIDNFWFAKQDISAGLFNSSLWTKNFIFESKLPFSFKNKFDIFQMDYKNSFIQNVKYKENSNSIKEYSFKLENLNTAECRSLLFFLEKKCGYKRFIYDFPVFFKSKKVFICTSWDHTFKYENCNDVNLTFIEDPSPNILIDTNNNYYVI